MKKFGIMCVCLTLLTAFLLLLPATAEPVNSGTCGENLTWKLDEEGLLTISGIGPMTDFSWNGSPWQQNASIKKVVVEAGVTSVGQYAFRECANLESVTLGKDVSSLENYAFLDCTALKELVVSENLQHIGDGAISSCSALNYTEYSNLRYLGSAENPFSCLVDCIDKNADFTIHPDTICIVDYAISRNKLTQLVIPDSVRFIANCAFMYCSNLTSVTIGSGLEVMDVNAFYGSNEVEKISISAENAYYTSDEAGVVYDKAMTRLVIVPGALSGDYVIPEGVTHIPAQAFYHAQLSSLSIPNSIESIGYQAIRSSSRALTFHTYDNAEYLGNAENPYLVLIKCTDTNLTKVEIHKDTKIILGAAFYASKLTEVTVPENVVEIGGQAFRWCESLTSVTLGNGVKYLRERAFESCPALESVYIPDTLETIESRAFYYCTALTGIRIPAALKEIGDDAFKGCSAMEAVTVDENNACYCLVDGVVYNKEKSEIVYVPAMLAGSITVPASVPSLNAHTFEKCTQLTEVIILTPVTEVVYGLFSECTSLKTVSLPATVQSIEKYGFAECTSLTDIYFGGTEKQWKALPVDYRNEVLSDVTVHYDAKLVSPDTPGNLNGDLLLNTDDVVTLLLHISMPDNFKLPENVFADFDGNGQITTEDAVKLLLYISMPDIFPLT